MIKNIFIVLLSFTTLLFLVLYLQANNSSFLNPLSSHTNQKVELPLEAYTYQNLKKRPAQPSTITFGDVVSETDTYIAVKFYYKTENKKVSGLAHLPKKAGTAPVIIQSRGYVDVGTYEPGVGTQHSAEVLAANGYISLAPDFLGFGESDKPSPIPFADRFETYTTILDLIASVPNLNAALQKSGYVVRADPNKIGLWGHSNGGQITLTIAELVGKKYPIVLWNPVSKPFPWSILYFTDYIEDHGRALRKAVADFEANYNSENYSLTNFLDWIQGPIQLDQAVNDEDVPIAWSDELYANLKAKGKDIQYITYPGENHNFNNGTWSTLMDHTLQFYNDQFKSQ